MTPEFLDYSRIVEIDPAEMEQGSEEWAQARCGNVTASRAADVIAVVKKGESAARRNYRSELISEILTGIPYPQYVSQEMKWGNDQEPFARAAYELQHDVLVETCGFILHSGIDRFGASPDGLVGDDGLIQIKCPNTATHLSWLMSGVIPVEHMPQMLAEMSCTQRAWCDFVSYDPRLPEHLQLYVKRFPRDAKLIAVLEREVEHFNRELDELLTALPQKPQGVVLSLDQVAEDEVQF
jgi:putative phage-type endonuclease